MVSLGVKIFDDEFEALRRIADEKFPFFGFLDDEEKVIAAIEYLIEKEVAVNGY